MAEWHEVAIGAKGPRAVRPSPIARKLLTFFRVLLSMVLIGGALTCYFKESSLRRLQARGVRVHGVVTSMKDSYGGDGTGQTLYLDCTYAWQGRKLSNQVEVDLRTYENSKRGTPMDVTFLPESPAEIFLAPLTDGRITEIRTPWVFWTSLAGLAVFALGRACLLRIREQVAFLENCYAAPARVTGLEPAGVESNKRSKIRFAFRNLDGKDDFRFIEVSLVDIGRVSLNQPTAALIDLREHGIVQLLPMIALAEVVKPTANNAHAR